MTTSDSSAGDSPAGEPPVPAQAPESRGTGVGFFAGAALTIVSVGLFVVSGFVFFSGDAGVAQPIATVLGGAGVFGAGVLTFRAAHNTRLSAEKTAADSLAHAQNVAANEKARHEKQLAEQREQAEAARADQAEAFERTHSREVLRDLRSRYTTCAEQLAHESAAIRLAGVYALASLADDWQQQDENGEKQVAIDLLRAYLRTPNIHTHPLIEAHQPDTGELEVRKAILFTLHGRSNLATVDDPKSWRGFDCVPNNADLSYGYLDSAALSGALLETANLSCANLTFANLSGASLNRANLSAANLTGADLSGVNLKHADLTGANLDSAYLSGAYLNRANLTGANLSGANLEGVHLNGASLDGASLDDAYLVGADLSSASLDGASLDGASLDDANLHAIRYSVDTRWPEGVVPPDSRDSRST